MKSQSGSTDVRNSRYITVKHYPVFLRKLFHQVKSGDLLYFNSQHIPYHTYLQINRPVDILDILYVIYVACPGIGVRPRLWLCGQKSCWTPGVAFRERGCIFYRLNKVRYAGRSFSPWSSLRGNENLEGHWVPVALYRVPKLLLPRIVLGGKDARMQEDDEFSSTWKGSGTIYPSQMTKAAEAQRAACKTQHKRPRKTANTCLEWCDSKWRLWRFIGYQLDYRNFCDGL